MRIRSWAPVRVWAAAVGDLLLFAAPAAAQNRVLHIARDANNNVHVAVTAPSARHPREVVIPAEAGQTGIEDVKIANDGSTGGWLVLYRNRDGGQAIAATLVLFRDGTILRRVRSGQEFWSWAFEPHGGSFAYHTGPLHGETTSHCELHDLATGRMLASWDGDLGNAERPAWTRALDH